MDHDEMKTGKRKSEDSLIPAASKEIATPTGPRFHSSASLKDKEAGRLEPRGFDDDSGISPPYPLVSTSKTPCALDEHLPSECIKGLWNKPLLSCGTISPVKQSPKEISGGKRKHFQKTPSRRNLLPPLKLQFDNLESIEESRKNVGNLRKSYSVPETGEAHYLVPKRIRLQEEATSPFEEFLNSKNTLKESNAGRRITSAVSTTSLTPSVKKLFVSRTPSDPTVSCAKIAVEQKEHNPLLIGDASTTYLLPTIPTGKHPDLKEITSATLAKLIECKEDYPDVDFKIIDCRYPYEYVGGHIIGASNLFMKHQIEKTFIEPKIQIDLTSEPETRKILIFHCEFSSKRGPKMCRHLRTLDRNSNLANYPQLFYPELYVLFGGYKDFFEHFPHLCEPSAYVPMDDPQFSKEFRVYKSKTKL